MFRVSQSRAGVRPRRASAHLTPTIGRARAIVGTAAVGAACLLSVAAQADYWLGPTNYLHTRTNMPDLDQQRSKPPFCALAPFPAIPTGNPNCPFIYPGGMHCGPTSGTDIYLYMANHGYPKLLPNGQLGDIWRQPQWFCTATSHIGTLGTLSGWSLNGTSTYGMMVGLQKAINAARQPIVAGHYLSSGTFGMNLNQLAETGRAGAVVMVAYGHYKVVGNAGGYPVVQRNGGHFVVMTGAYRNDPICKLRIRDPADDGCTPDLPTQAEYKNHWYNAVNGWVRVAAPGLPWRWMTRIYPEASPPGFGIGSTISLLDGMTWCAPRKGVGKKLIDGVAGNAFEFYTVAPEDGWSEEGRGLVCEPLDLGIDGTILGATNHPDGRGVIGLVEVATEGAAGAPATTRMLVSYDPGIDLLQELAEIPGAETFVIGRNRAIYSATESTLERTELADEAEEEQPDVGDGDFAGPPTSVALPFSVSALCYDDLNDEIVGLSDDSMQVAFVAKDFGGEVGTFSMPGEVAAAAGGSIASNPEDGVLWFGSSASSTIYGLSKPSAKAGASKTLEVVEQIDLPLEDGAVIKDLDFLGGDEFVVIAEPGGTLHFIRESEADDTGWRQVQEEPFSLPCSLSGIEVDRGRGNFDAKEHETPGYDNLIPGDLIPGNPLPDPLCLGDLNGDGLVDGIDLGVLLGEWGEDAFVPSDFNDDGKVDGDDLGTLLGQWGPCP